MIIIKLSSWATLYYELFGPFLLFSPIYFEQSRIFCVVAFIIMHFMFGMSLHIGFFMYIPMVVASSFFPDLFWQKAMAFIFAIKKKLFFSGNRQILLEEKIFVYFQLNSKNSLRYKFFRLFKPYWCWPNVKNCILLNN